MGRITVRCDTIYAPDEYEVSVDQCVNMGSSRFYLLNGSKRDLHAKKADATARKRIKNREDQTVTELNNLMV